MSLSQHLMRGLAALVMAHAAMWSPMLAQAQSNSREAVEAARKHRAEQDGAARSAPARAARDRPYRSSADPTANPRASLRSCLDHSGMNLAARDRCMRQHCEGRWGQGDCPAQGGDLINRSVPNRHTPLGKCLSEAGANPFRRDACGWRHCNGKWETPECAAIRPRGQPLAQ